MPRRDRSPSHRCTQSPYARRLRVETLEDRRLLAVLTVQNNLDDTLANLAGDGELSLREAIEIANNPGLVIDGFSSGDVADEIVFDPSVSGQTVLLIDGPIEIEDALHIDATALSENPTIDAQQQSHVFWINDPAVTNEDFDVTLTGRRSLAVAVDISE